MRSSWLSRAILYLFERTPLGKLVVDHHVDIGRSEDAIAEARASRRYVAWQLQQVSLRAQHPPQPHGTAPPPPPKPTNDPGPT